MFMWIYPSAYIGKRFGHMPHKYFPKYALLLLYTSPNHALHIIYVLIIIIIIVHYKE